MNASQERMASLAQSSSPSGSALKRGERVRAGRLSRRQDLSWCWGLSLGGLAWLAAACAGGGASTSGAPETQLAGRSETVSPAPASPAAASSSAPVEASTPATHQVPTTCASSGSKLCTPPVAWVKSLCADVYPEVALYLFQPSMPFTRGYLSRKTKAVNASGGVTSGAEYLAFDEEVLLLRERGGGGGGGMSVSGDEGGYDALRWDGSCVTLDASEVRLQKPPKAQYPGIDFRGLGDASQEALKSVPKVRDAVAARKKECKGVYQGEVSKTCVQKDAALSTVIVAAVQGGEVKLPEPSRQP